MSFQSDHPDQERKHHQFLKTHSPYPILITTAPKVTITLTSNTIDQFHFNFQSLFVSVSSFPSSHLCPLSLLQRVEVVSASVSEALSFHLIFLNKAVAPVESFCVCCFQFPFPSWGVLLSIAGYRWVFPTPDRALWTPQTPQT